MTYYRGCNKSHTTAATSRAGTAYPSGAPAFSPFFFVGSVPQSRNIRSGL